MGDGGWQTTESRQKRRRSKSKSQEKFKPIVYQQVVSNNKGKTGRPRFENHNHVTVREINNSQSGKCIPDEPSMGSLVQSQDSAFVRTHLTHGLPNKGGGTPSRSSSLFGPPSPPDWLDMINGQKGLVGGTGNQSMTSLMDFSPLLPGGEQLLNKPKGKEGSSHGGDQNNSKAGNSSTSGSSR